MGIPVALLLLVAANQIVLARTADLTPWKGGGFGMFSTTDRAASRCLRVYVAAPDRDEELRLPAELQDLGSRAAALPSQARLSAVAEEIANRERRAGRSVSTIRVEVWRVEFLSLTMAPRAHKLREIVHVAG